MQKDQETLSWICAGGISTNKGVPTIEIWSWDLIKHILSVSEARE